MQKQQGAPVCLSLEFRFLCASVSFCVFSCIFLSTALSSSPAAVKYVRVWVCIYMVWNGKEWTGLEIMKMSEHEKANCHWEGEKKQNIGLKCERLQFAVHGFWYIIGTLAAVGVCVCVCTLVCLLVDGGACCLYRKNFPFVDTFWRLQNPIPSHPARLRKVCCFIRISLIKQHEILHAWRYYMGDCYSATPSMSNTTHWIWLWIWKMSDSFWLHA